MEELRQGKSKRNTGAKCIKDRPQGASDTGAVTSGDGTSSPFVVGSAGSSASSGSERQGPVRQLRGLPKAGIGAHAPHQQRLFPSAPRDMVVRNHSGFQMISESPPSDSVGFFFGSTPPDIGRSVFLEVLSISCI